jgi:ABC-type uncharacterized transport system ATPase subunit
MTTQDNLSLMEKIATTLQDRTFSQRVFIDNKTLLQEAAQAIRQLEAENKKLKELVGSFVGSNAEKFILPSSPSTGEKHD